MGSLPTLNPPAPIDVGRLVQLKNLIQAQPLQMQQLQQQVQAGQLGIQEQQRAIAREDALNKAWQSALTNDPTTGAPKLDEGAFMNATAASGWGSAAQPALEHFAQYHKTLNENKQLEQKIAEGQRDEAGAAGYALQKGGYDPYAAKAMIGQRINDPNLDPQHKTNYAQALQSIDQALQQGGVDAAKKVVQQFADPMVAQSEKYSKIQTEDIAAQARALTAQTGVQRLQFEKEGGLPPDKRELNAWLKKNPGKDEADFLVYKSKLAPQAQINVANAAGGGLSDTALEQAAQRYLQTGQLPPGARGVVGLAQNRKIMNRAAELDPSASLTANAAINKSYSQALDKLQAQNSSVEAFEGTAKRNLQLLSDKIDAIPDLGTRFANVPLRMIQSKMIGDKNLAEMNAALLTARSETARVLASATAAGAVPVEQQKEVQAALDGNMPAKTAKGVIQTFMQDMENRRQSYSEQIGDLQQRLRQGQGGGGAQRAAPTQPLEITLPSGKKVTIK